MLGLSVRGSLFSEELIIGGNFAFQNGLDLTIKTASTNSPWAYIRECLLSKGNFRLRFGGLIFGRAYFWGGYYRDFTVLYKVITSLAKIRQIREKSVPVKP